MNFKEKVSFSPVELEKSKSFPIMEMFYSIQGEGFYSGTPAYFIRLGGCDVGCHWCDVKESWNADSHPAVSIDEIISNAESSKAKHIIVTGGEPLMYDLTDLTRDLKRKNFKLHLETSGAYPLTGEWDWICLSPKKFKEPLAEIYSKANELKMIIYNKDDLRWAEENAKKMYNGKWLMVNGGQPSTINHQPLTIQLFLQPEWSKKNEMLPLIVDHVRQNPKWRISLQTHKYIGVR